MTGRGVILGQAVVDSALWRPLCGFEGDTLYELPQRVKIIRLGNRDNVTVASPGRPFRLFVGRKRPSELEHGSPSDRSIANPFDLLLSGFLVEASPVASDEFRVRLVTDKYGHHPLYYSTQDSSLFFSDHLPSLQRLLSSRSEAYSADDLVHFYHFGFTRGDRSLFREIRKVPAGSLLEFGERGVTVIRYFSIGQLYRPDEFAGRSETELSAAIEKRLASSVRKRVVNGSMSAIALSGGVDSGLIAKAITGLGVPARGYNLIYRGHYSESDRVERLSKAIGLEVRRLEVEPEDVLEQFLAANSECSEPVSFNAAIMRMVAGAAARDGAATLFDGDGADRLFLGMNRYLQYKRILALFRCARSLGLAGMAARMLLWLRSDEARKVAKLYRAWNEGIRPYPERTIDAAAPFDLGHERELYDLAIRHYEQDFREEFSVDDLWLFFSYVSIRMCPEMFFHAPAEIQEQSGLSPASAFWDDDLVSLAISLPVSLKLRGRNTKYILRRTAASMLGSDYAFLPKVGLQSAGDFLMRSSAGRSWHDRVIEEIQRSEEYEILRQRLPGASVVPDRLIPLHVWKQSRRSWGGVRAPE